MLKLLDITKEYIVEKESTLALKGVSIEFRKNEFVSILGPSGCGKTTLLNIIGGLDRYTSGDIQIDEISTKQYDDVDWDTYRNRKIGFVFQSYNLIPHMNILKNVAMSLTIAGVDREERKARALEALRKVGLESQARKRPNQLSGGQMQRVAIARALVNNPDIILADEPTGALDSESGIQVMDLLKEVAEDRLVIMVTHNPMLAEEYSTRIVYLKDGEVEGDTMPYNSKEENDGNDRGDGMNGGESGGSISLGGAQAGEDGDMVAYADETPAAEAPAASVPEKSAPAQKKKKSCEKWARIKRFLMKKRQLDKTAMKLSTAINLSWNNLLSKKGRTLLTSIAGSIGIIGIILVLSLSTGAKQYITNLEESALSSYPLSVNRASMDIGSIMTMLSGGSSSNGKFDENVITTEMVLGGIISNFETLISENDLKSLKTYIEDNFDSELADVKYDYGITFNAFAEDPANVDKDDDKKVYMKVNPYSEMMYAVFAEFMEDPTFKGFIDKIGDKGINIMGMDMDFNTLLGYMANMVGDSWAEMSDNQTLLDHQYDLVGNSRWPQKANEVVIVVNENNTFMDFQLFMLGLKSTEEVIKALVGGSSFATATYNVNDLIGREMKIMTNSDYLEDNGDGTWTMHDRSDLLMSYVDEHAMKFYEGTSDETDKIKVVGVVRPKKGVVATSINGVVGYTSKLTELMHSHTQNHPAVKAMLKAYSEALKAHQASYESPIKYTYTKQSGAEALPIECEIYGDIYLDDEGCLEGLTPAEKKTAVVHMDLMRQLGFVNEDYLVSINFYCYSFEAKDQIVSFLAQYEKDTHKTIKYNDSLSSMMAFVNTMANTITGVLVAFAAISLIVSTIMIAIIIYTSVLERRKEIGVLRSIGARKKDISRVFLAESAILGGYSGIIGIIVSAIISAIGSVILSKVFNIDGLMSIQWWHCLMMFLISVLLSMFAGFIPAHIASRKDPAIALRSE